MANWAAWTVEWYRTARGEAPAQTFLAALDGLLATEAVALLAYVRVRGQALREPRSKSLGEGLFELRGRHGVRLFYTFRPGRRIVVLDGMVKKRQDIPADVLARVRAYQRAV
jgi:phage-related protein